jgi:protoporphyrinogen/coproporphyrinogen III oxidase
MSRRVVVIGAGPTGLAAAHRLLCAEDPPEVVVLEASARPGGRIRSVTVDRLELEAGPDSFLARKPWAVDLCKELGLEDELLPATAGNTQLWTERGLVPFPPGPLGVPPSLSALWRGAVPSAPGKLRAAADLVLPRRRSSPDGSVGALLRRRLGRRATEELVEPLLGGVLAGDIERLSVRATFPELGEWEREHGSLIRGARAASGARRPADVGGSGTGVGGGAPPVFVTIRGGLGRMIEALVAAIGPSRVRLSAPATGIRAEGSGFAVSEPGGDVAADAVIVTAPAYASAELLSDVAHEAGRRLDGIAYTSGAVAVLVYPDGTDVRLPASSGFLARRGLLPIAAATIVSKKWPDTAFGSRAVVRAFVGEGETLALSDEELVVAVARALATVYGLPTSPRAASVIRWPRSMPQYEVGHLDRVDAIEAALPRGIVVAGNAFRGLGLPDAVRQGAEAAGRVAAILARA